jgi:hypothetical protein
VITNENGGIPGQEDTAAETLATTTDDNPQGNTSTNVEVVNPDLVRSWAESILKAAVGTVPLPGTAAWAALADDDVRKRAAVIYAALWWCDQHTAEAIEHRADWDQLLQQLDEKQFAVAFSASRDWGTCRSWEELQRRRTTYTTGRTVDPAAVGRWVRTGSSAEIPADAGFSARPPRRGEAA